MEKPSLQFLNTFAERVRTLVRILNPRERIVFSILAVVAIFSFAAILWQVNRYFLVEIPADGGSLTEGVIGIPRFINPLLAVSEADRDMTLLLYAGLMRATKSGLVPDLAESYEISDDGLVYTFTLREGLEFHDGSPITADDVEFTILKAQEPALKSPKRANWEGVTIEKIDERHVRFTLKQPYAPFLENTTLGILPKMIWKNASADQFSFSEFNIRPVGSGPYEVSDIKRNSSGIPEYYDLAPFANYALEKPHIKNVQIRFYSNEDALIRALRSGDIEAVNAISPNTARALVEEGLSVSRAPLPRVFGVFFNQNQAPIFAEKTVRRALSEAIAREEIIRDVLFGYGTPIEGPIPPGSRGFNGEIPKNDATAEDRLTSARAILENDGWILGSSGIYEKKKSKKETIRLAFSLSTSDVPELKSVAERLKADWEKIGVSVELKVFESGDLNQNVIRPRKYDAILFGEIVGRDSDLFAFWHSSQRNDPGLNIAMYTNSVADKLLEDMRRATDPEKRRTAYEKFSVEIAKDIPAVFLYAPEFVYILPEKIKGSAIGTITVPAERFLNIHEWYIDTDLVWKIFAQ
ncbi:MAG: peptide ABC transporter substrate-binding protein [Patescibacteria group bacterium]